MPKTQTHNTPAAAAEAETQPRITDFDPTRTSGVYDALRDSWLLNRDFAEMHLHVLRSGEYLDPFGSGGPRRPARSTPGARAPASPSTPAPT